jgi:PASTA domain
MGDTTPSEDETPGEGVPPTGDTPGAEEPGGETSAGAEELGETALFEPGGASAPVEPGDETTRLTPEDETTRLTPDDLRRPTEEEAGATSIMPSGPDAPAWSGRAGVPAAPGGLRDSAPYQPYQPPYQQGEPPPSRTWWTPALLGMLALGLVGVVLLAAFMISRESRPGPKPAPTATPAPQPTQTPGPVTKPPTGPPTASVQLVQVPQNLIGMSQGDATALLDKVGLSYSLNFQESTKPKGTVIASTPEPGKLVPAFSVVKLLISLGSPSPSVSASKTP